ncbi:MAG: glycosyltransferase family 2 protein [Helicobacteraceae bacterium]|nr:glycosyltransferase family 2 protein [Helicobacteraceae bacterium]
MSTSVGIQRQNRASPTPPPPPPPEGGVLLSIVVPCYNEAENIPLFYAKSCEVLKVLEGQGVSVEFVFIDDGSKDETAKVIQELSEKDERIRYAIFSRNFGKEAAMLAGLQAAKGDFTAMLDADLQHPPSLLPAMLEAVKNGEYDCAGTIRTRTGDSKIRTFFSRAFYRLISKLSNMEIIDGAGDFRLMSRQYVDAILSLSERNRFSKGIFQWIGFRTKWFYYENQQRASGDSKWSFWKLFIYSLDGIIAFSSKLLAIASAIGIILFILSICAVIFIVVRKLIFGDPIQGWASTICVILFCAGVQLLTTGVLGEYLAKTYNEVKRRPHFVIRKQK